MSRHYTICCCVCGKDMQGTGWLCHRCAKNINEMPNCQVIGVSFAQWPDWLKECARTEHNRRRVEKREWGKVFPFSQSITGERKALGEWSNA